MATIELKCGDVFCSRNPMWLGRAINWVQKFWSLDNESKYSHAGIILDSKGSTFESLWTVKRQNLFKAYAGTEVLIGRHELIDQESPLVFTKGFDVVRGYYGKWYPFHRLFLHLFPPLAKYLSFGPCVCSEMVAKFLCGCGVIKYWKGRNPDHLADMIRDGKGWTVVYEGKLE